MATKKSARKASAGSRTPMRRATKSAKRGEKPAARDANGAAQRGATSSVRPAAARPTEAATASRDTAATGAGNDPFAFMQPWLQAMAPASPGASSEAAPVAMQGLFDMQQDYVHRLASLWTDFFSHPERTTEQINDPRFSDEAWQSNPLASFYARAYLLNSEFMGKMADSVQADPKTRRRLKFAVSQWVDAASPSNFLATNPRAQQRLIETGGESLKSGMENLLGDMRKGKITMTDESAFEVGLNVATSEGMVVYECPLFQLIQYKPLTAKVNARPFLLVPPCINKYYILDLQPDNSFVRFSVEQGNTVFLVSWKNPHEPEAGVTWDDYLEKGVIEAIHVTQDITGSKQINALGFCVGGTLICNALAVMYARGENPVSSLTLLTALLDFEDAGVLDIFIDEAHVLMREQQMGRGGLMPGRDLANTFSSLRANDLVWNYYVSNYLEGKSPPAFDLLYWNGDSTNLPGPMYAWYLRNMYLENKLRIPNRLVCAGVPVDLEKIRAPVYVFAAREDHIVPWKAAYASGRLLPGAGKRDDVRFVLGASGHIAGTINPPTKNKRNYWVGGTGSLPATADAWLNSAIEKPGSWWPDWNAWLASYSGGEKAAPKTYGSAKYKPIEAAPGRYVQEKS